VKLIERIVTLGCWALALACCGLVSWYAFQNAVGP